MILQCTKTRNGKQHSMNSKLHINLCQCKFSDRQLDIYTQITSCVSHLMEMLSENLENSYVEEFVLNSTSEQLTVNVSVGMAAAFLFVYHSHLL